MLGSAFAGLRTLYQIATIVGMALAAVTVNELVELALDFFTGSSAIGPGVWDTNLDLLMNSAAIVVYIIFRFSRRSTGHQHQ